MKRTILFCIALCSCLVETHSQTISKDLYYFAIDQFVMCRYDTAKAKTAHVYNATGEKLPDYTVGHIKVKFYYSLNDRKYLRKMWLSDGKYNGMFMNRFGNDTVDFDFATGRVKRTLKGYGMAVNCGGDWGYIPDHRFIYSKERDEWEYHSFQELWEKRRDEIEEYYRQLQSTGTDTQDPK